MLSRRGFLGSLGLFTLGCRARLHAADVREIERTVAGTRTRDGAGVALRRTLGGRELPMLDPFLMLDEIHSDRPEDWQAGFPDHPHRGFETVSYLIAGTFEHADSVGNRGVIGPGAAQWMTAGRGIIHSEMPRQEPGRDLWGLQLWVNLPAADKMTRPRYQELAPAQIPLLDAGGARVRLVAGSVDGRRGPIEDIRVAPTMLDATLPPRGRLQLALPGGHAAFLQALSGEVAIGTRRQRVGDGALAVLGPGSALVVESDAGARILLLAAAPIREPVARRGPFVMNTDEEIRQAISDYRSGRLVDG
jgi:redox-sensitive bicupin YhaK (pirin superfamily)